MVISEVTAFLEDMFDVLNDKYFEGSLPRPIITIQSSPKAYGHFCNDIWAEDGSGTKSESNIGAETLNRKTIFTVCTMLHEQVHYYCYLNGIKDFSRSTGNSAYHNKRFKVEAEKRDLHIDYDPRIGWSITSPTDALREFVAEQGWSKVNLARMGLYGLVGGTKGGAGTDTDGGSSKTKKKSNVRRYVCPVCGAIARTTKDLQLSHIPCGAEMELQEKAG